MLDIHWTSFLWPLKVATSRIMRISKSLHKLSRPPLSSQLPALEVARKHELNTHMADLRE